MKRTAGGGKKETHQMPSLPLALKHGGQQHPRSPALLAAGGAMGGGGGGGGIAITMTEEEEGTSQRKGAILM